MLVLGLQLPSHSSNYEFWGTEYPSCLFSFTPRCNTLTSFPPPPPSFRYAQKPSMIPTLAQHESFYIRQCDAFIFPEDEKVCFIPKLAGGGRCSVQWSISWLVGSDMHSLYPKLHEDELLTSTPARTAELETSLFSLLVKQSLFTVKTVWRWQLRLSLLSWPISFQI